jgi:hypothetical protein
MGLLAPTSSLSSKERRKAQIDGHRSQRSRFQLNRETGTIKGSEWISNCFYCVQTADQGLEVYREFFSKKLKIGKDGPVYDDGFSM